MGLDITAYATVTLVEAVALKELQAKEWDHPLYDDGEHIFISTDEWKQFDGPSGFYTHGKSFGFRAGSYSGYNHWREQLAALVDTTPERVWNGHVPPAFRELINFSDAEGTLGGAVCAKLAKDFAEWQDRATEYAKTIVDPQSREWFLAKYADWRKAFDLASGDGAVDFH